MIARAARDAYRGLGWAHGALTVQRLGAMMAPVTFVLADGRQVSPMHIAPWANEPVSHEQPGILQRLRGDFSCVPFGYSVRSDGWPREWASVMSGPAFDEEPHGYCSNREWAWTETSPGSIALGLDYPPANAIKRVERRLTPDPDGPAVDIEFKIFVHEACRVPIGLHPVFRLPQQPGQARLELGAFSIGRTYPHDVEAGTSIFAANRTFDDIASVPARGQGSLDASQLPFAAETEELLQIEGLDGRVALANLAENYRAILSWQPEQFPSLLLWYSNRGRKFEPWNGRNLSLGIEPICSPFGLGPATALADNPIALSGVPTAVSMSPDAPFVTRYRIEVEPL